MPKDSTDRIDTHSAEITKPYIEAFSALALNTFVWNHSRISLASKRRIARHLATAFRSRQTKDDAKTPGDPIRAQKHVDTGVTMLLISRHRTHGVDGLRLIDGGRGTVSVEVDTKDREREYQFALTLHASPPLADLLMLFPEESSPEQSALAKLMIGTSQSLIARICGKLADAPLSRETDHPPQLQDFMTAAALVSVDILGASFRAVSADQSTDILRLEIEAADGRAAYIPLTTETANHSPAIAVREANAIWPGYDEVNPAFEGGHNIARLELRRMPIRTSSNVTPAQAIEIVRSISGEQISFIATAAKSLILPHSQP